jgi:hypothetical protein
MKQEKNEEFEICMYCLIKNYNTPSCRRAGVHAAGQILHYWLFHAASKRKKREKGNGNKKNAFIDQPGCNAASRKTDTYKR